MCVSIVNIFLKKRIKNDTKKESLMRLEENKEDGGQGDKVLCGEGDHHFRGCREIQQDN